MLFFETIFDHPTQEEGNRADTSLACCELVRFKKIVLFIFTKLSPMKLFARFSASKTIVAKYQEGFALFPSNKVVFTAHMLQEIYYDA
jgi:hypothetical protein